MSIEQEAPEWSNADEVIKFLDDHKDIRFEAGDYLELPDIEQVYTVVAARPFRREGSFYLFLDLETTCAVEKCDNQFVVSMDVNRWRKSRYITRCCPEHPRWFNTPMPMAWKTIEERMDLAEVNAQRSSRRRYREEALRKMREQPRYGSAQAAVVSAVKDLTDVLGREPTDADTIKLACAKLPRPGSARDTRKQQTTRALASLRRRGLL